jgi:hypothetical protein
MSDFKKFSKRNNCPVCQTTKDSGGWCSFKENGRLIINCKHTDAIGLRKGIDEVNGYVFLGDTGKGWPTFGVPDKTGKREQQSPLTEGQRKAQDIARWVQTKDENKQTARSQGYLDGQLANLKAANAQGLYI